MLNVSRLIQVTVNLGAIPAVGRAFNCLCIAGDSAVISGAQRIIGPLTSLEAVASAGFSLTSPEYLAAELYYGQSPKPTNLMIGRWLATATSGFNLGGIQSPTQQVLSNWTAITSGGFKVAIDGGAATNVASLNFSSVTNLNGVASVISTGLTSASLAAVCTWNGSAFVITSNSTGPGAQASGTITFSANPTANDTVTVNGTAVTFVGSSPIGNQVVIGANDTITLANLLTFLQQSTDTNISQATYSAVGLVITVLDKTAGVGGNSFTLAKSSSALAVSGADLSGGTAPSSVSYAIAPTSGTDISAMLALTSATSQALVAGFAAESPAACTQALATASTLWYGLMFSATASITISQSLAVSSLIEGLTVTRFHGVSTSDANTLSSLVSNDLASLMKASAYKHSMIQYSSTTPHCIASMFGRMFSVDFNAQNSTIELMWKQEPGVVAENLTDTTANALQGKNCNVYTGYDNDTSIIQYGVCSSGDFIDQIWGLDWFQNAVQTSVYNLFYTATTKIPQTDAGQNQLENAIAQVCGNQPGGAVWNGLAGPGTWNDSTVFGTLQPGQYLPLGYYLFAPSVELQSESDRAARLAPPTQIALKMAGAFQEADVIVTVNR